MSSSGEEEDAGPSVDSADQEERIAARRLRIARRLEAQKRYFSTFTVPFLSRGGTFSRFQQPGTQYTQLRTPCA